MGGGGLGGGGGCQGGGGGLQGGRGLRVEGYRMGGWGLRGRSGWVRSPGVVGVKGWWDQRVVGV